jgi:hypothetical protein
VSWQPDYCTRTELESYLRITDGLDEPQFDMAIAAASRAVDNTCRRQFGQADSLTARIYTACVDYRGRWVVDIDDLMDTTGMTVAADTAGDGGFATTVTGYSLGPRNAAANGEPFTEVISKTALPVSADSVRVTAKWGWTEVPPTVKQATLLQASRILARRESPYGITGSPESGGETRLMSVVDPTVAEVLRPFTRRWWAV